MKKSNLVWILFSIGCGISTYIILDVVYSDIQKDHYQIRYQMIVYQCGTTPNSGCQGIETDRLSDANYSIFPQIKVAQLEKIPDSHFQIDINTDNGDDAGTWDVWNMNESMGYNWKS